MKLKSLLFLVLVASPAFARIISYTPYSNRISRSVYQERTTRWFMLIENDEAVLYDSAGIHEPRVVYGPTNIWRAALYERRNAPDAPPVLLVNERTSVDGGATWRVGGYFGSSDREWDVDTGGPFVHGLAAKILPGTDEMPFIIEAAGHIWAYRISGAVAMLHGGAPNFPDKLIGRNAAGDRFLIQAGTKILTLDLFGNTTLVTTAALSYRSGFTGWLTSDGSAYLLASRTNGRYLSFYRGGERQFVAGPVGEAPQFDNEGGAFPQMRSFAVPTHDFNGAWIIQRQAGGPTTLSRHTPGRGLETMWSDPSGPEVEALIAGASGETVLVQVHRNRPMPGAAPPIIDPALAVWHVGDPMPAEYDELYLHEEWNKGFIHVDVDGLESGEAFVFNSGFVIRDDGDVIFSGGGGGDIIQEWGAVRGSLKQRLVLPGVARTRGAFGSHWFTDVTVYNPFDDAQEVEVRFTPMGEEDLLAPVAGRTTTLALAPLEIRVLEDVLSLFGVANGGGTLLFLPAKAVNVTGRTYSRSPRGTFGFGMYAIDFFNAAGPRFPLSFGGAFPGEHFRTNILLTDTSGRGAEAEIRAHRGSSVIVADSTIAAPASGTAQFNNVTLAPAGPLVATQQSGALIVATKRGMTIPMVVAIDNRSNDPTYLPPDLGTSIPRVIPAVGHLDGAHGSRFRRDIFLFNTTTKVRDVVLRVTPWNTTREYGFSLTLQGNETRMIPDALMTLFGLTGIARLSYESSGYIDGWRFVRGGVSVTSRTYSVDASGATYGCLIPPLNGFQSASQGERLEILMGVGEGFRTNLALVQVDSQAFGALTRVQIEIFDESGRSLSRFLHDLQSETGVQINDLFKFRGIAAPSAARIVIDVLSGRSIASYVTVIDNATNDTTYYAGQLGAKN